MELALLPIAAVLLLLSGAGAPAHSLGPKSTSAVLMRHLLGASGPAAQPFAGSRNLLRAQGLVNRKRSASTAFRLALNDLLGYSPSASSTPQPPVASLRRLYARQYRTRFGFADGAYRATAPPAGPRQAV